MTRRLWIAVEAHLMKRYIVFHAAEVLKVKRYAALGLLVALWGEAAEDAKGGDISGLLDSQLEAWSGWDGEPGLFAGFVRAHCVTNGVLNSWDEMQGPLEARRAHDRDRLRAFRERKKRNVSETLPETLASVVTEQNRTEPTTTTSDAEKPKGERPKLPPAPKPPIDPRVELILAHYVRVHPKRRPSPKIRLCVIRALRSYEPEELIAAIDGNAADPWHREKGKHELDYVLRDNEKIDSFRLRPAPRDWSKEQMIGDDGLPTAAMRAWEAAGSP